MEFPEEYKKRGKFELHSGEETDTFYDVNALLTNPEYLFMVLNRIPKAEHYVGIATGGAIISACVSLRRMKPYSIIKDNELKGPQPSGRWVLIDDVGTTESSLEESLKLINSKPEKIFVVVDRRKKQDRTLNVVSMFEV